MEERKLSIGEIPSIIYGRESEKVYIYIHGQYGHKEESRAFAELAEERGWQTLAFDLPDHGERRGEGDTFYPWNAVPELSSIMEYAASKWKDVALMANSIGAWFSLLAFGKLSLIKCLMISPLLDMRKLISGMMKRAGVTPAELEEKKTIATESGETLSWRYYQYALDNPVERWSTPTAILYAGNDNFTSRDTVEAFAEKFSCRLEIMENGEHWFHTAEQLAVLDSFLRDNV